MRTAKEPTFVRTDNVGETKRATIKASAKIFNFFSEQIYSDKFTAIWRELVANAIDAQKMNGATRAPVVTVPSMLEPYAKVRDFGCSMDHEFMMDKFMAFTDASTKEHSDDYIGGFGIGSKAPLSYTEQYSIKCYMNGEVRVYSIFKDEEGCPSIAFLSKDATDEPDGVEVGFPVRQDDVNKFTETVVRTLQYFDPLPVLEGTDLKLEPVEYDAKGDKWGIRVMGPNSNRANIVIGGVAYPLDRSAIPYEYQELKRFATFGLDVFLDIGEANIALSREHVTHDDALFKKLNKIVGKIGPEFGAQLSKKFSSAKTMWDAKVLLNEAINKADYSTKEILRKYAYWNGKKITMSIGRPDDFEVLTICYGDFDWNSGVRGMNTTKAVAPKFRAWLENGAFRPNSFDMIVYDDGPEKPSLRIRKVIDENPDSRILFLRNNSDDEIKWDDYFAALGNPPASIITKLSKYAPLKVARSAAGTASRPFKCYVRDSRPYTGSTPQGALPVEGGMYIVMNNFSAESKSDDIAIARRSEPENIVWLNLTDYRASGIKDNPDWYSVEEGIKKVKATYRSEHSDLPEAEGWYLADVADQTGIIDEIEELAELSSFPKRGPLLQLYRLFQKHEAVNSSDHHNVRSELLNVDGTKHRDRILKLVEDVKAKHPLIAEVCGKWRVRNQLSEDVMNRLF